MQNSIHTTAIDALDLDSEAYDRLESFYGKIQPRSSKENAESKQQHQVFDGNVFVKQGDKNVAFPILDLQNLQ